MSVWRKKSEYGTTLPQIAFVASSVLFQSPSPQGMIAEKIQPYVEIFREQGLEVGLYHPISRNPPSRKAEQVVNLLNSHIKSIPLSALRHLARGGGWRGLRDAEITWRIETYSRFITRRRVSMIFGVCIPEELVSAARRHGILTVELQHGMVAVENLMGYWPKGIYPDMFLAWDNESGSVANFLGIRPIVVGYPMMGDALQTSPKLKGGSICVTLGKGRSPSADPFGCFALRLHRAVTEMSSSDINFFFRIHPGIAFKRSKARRLTSWLKREFPGVEVHNPRHTSLIDDIGKASLHVTFHSAASIEFGLNGIISVECDADFFSDISRQFASSDLSSDLIRLYQPGEHRWDSFQQTAASINPPQFTGHLLTQESIRGIFESE